jgi:bisphosphoglycerate-dependent phosphoglycerate mutase
MPLGTSDGQYFDTEFDYWHNKVFGEEDDKSKGEARDSDGVGKTFLVRHGDTDLNNEDIIHGWVSTPLNDEGIADAHKAADSLKDKNITRIVSSDLPRAKQTANILSQKLKVPVTFDPNLRTWDSGDFDGTKDHEEFKKYTIPAKTDLHEYNFMKDYPQDYRDEDMARRKKEAIENSSTLDEYLDNRSSLFGRDYIDNPIIKPYANQAYKATKYLKQLYEQGDPDVRKMVDDYEQGRGQHPYNKPDNVDKDFLSSTAGTLTGEREWDMFIQLKNALLGDMLDKEEDNFSDLTDKEFEFLDNATNFDSVDRPFMEMPESLKQRMREKFPPISRKQ